MGVEYFLRFLGLYREPRPTPFMEGFSAEGFPRPELNLPKASSKSVREWVQVLSPLEGRASPASDPSAGGRVEGLPYEALPEDLRGLRWVKGSLADPRAFIVCEADRPPEIFFLKEGKMWRIQGRMNGEVLPHFFNQRKARATYSA